MPRADPRRYGSQLLADLHYKRRLLLQVSWRPWRAFVSICRQQQEAAQQHRLRSLCRKGFWGWRWAMIDTWRARVHRDIEDMGRAADLRRVSLLRKGLAALARWAAAGRMARKQLLRRSLLGLRCAANWRRQAGLLAASFALRHVAGPAFFEWRDEARRLRDERLLAELQRELDARDVWRRSLVRSCLRGWALAARQEREERVQQERRAAMRAKVRGWIEEHRATKAQSQGFETPGPARHRPRTDEEDEPLLHLPPSSPLSMLQRTPVQLSKGGPLRKPHTDRPAGPSSAAPSPASTPGEGTGSVLLKDFSTLSQMSALCRTPRYNDASGLAAAGIATGTSDLDLSPVKHGDNMMDLSDISSIHPSI